MYFILNVSFFFGLIGILLLKKAFSNLLFELTIAI